jgi:hypothetical protein
MLAETDHRTDASGAARSDTPHSPHHQIAAITADATRAVRKASRSGKAQRHPEALHSWKRPSQWHPFASFSEGMAALNAARQVNREAVRARIDLSAPYIAAQGPGYHDYMFSRTPEEAEAKNPNIPKDLIAAGKAERAAREAYDVVRQRVAVTPAHGAEIIQKLRIIVQPLDDVLDPACAEDMRLLRQHPDEYGTAVEVAALHDDLIRAFGPQEDRAVWDAASAELKALDAKRDAIHAEADDLQRQIDAIAPEWLLKPHALTGELVTICDTLGRFNFEAADRPALAKHREEFVRWTEANADLISRRDAAYLRCDEVYNEWCDAERALIETPAPDLQAVAFKQARLARQLDDHDRGFDDPVWFAVARDISYVQPSWLAHIFSDLKRLAGEPLPAFDPFRPRDWRNRFEAVGGTVRLSEDGDGFTTSCAAPPDGDLVAAGTILSELEQGQAKEVLLRYLQELS